jgi:hypothetical protein
MFSDGLLENVPCSCMKFDLCFSTIIVDGPEGQLSFCWSAVVLLVSCRSAGQLSFFRWSAVVLPTERMCDF